MPYFDDSCFAVDATRSDRLKERLFGIEKLCGNALVGLNNENASIEPYVVSVFCHAKLTEYSHFGCLLLLSCTCSEMWSHLTFDHLLFDSSHKVRSVAKCPSRKRERGYLNACIVKW